MKQTLKHPSVRLRILTPSHTQPSNEIRHANAIVDSISTEPLPFLSGRDDFTNELIRKHTIPIFPGLPRLVPIYCSYRCDVIVFAKSN